MTLASDPLDDVNPYRRHHVQNEEKMRTAILFLVLVLVAAAPASANPLFRALRNATKSDVACAPKDEKDARCNCRTLVEKVLDHYEGKNADCAKQQQQQPPTLK
jgi:hypothetical protein